MWRGSNKTSFMDTLFVEKPVAAYFFWCTLYCRDTVGCRGSPENAQNDVNIGENTWKLEMQNHPGLVDSREEVWCRISCQ